MSIHYMTLAAVRMEDPEAFDAAIKQAWHDAAEEVGHEVVMSAIYGQDDQAKELKAA